MWVTFAQRAQRMTVPGVCGVGEPQWVQGCWRVIRPLPQLAHLNRAFVGMGSAEPQ